MSDLFWYFCAVVYSKVYGFFHDHFHFGLPKLGYFLSRISEERPFKIDGTSFWFSPSLASSFGRMLGGSFNEKETHLFLNSVMKEIQKVNLFVEVGSNVGEFIIPVAASGKVEHVIGFEPTTECVRVSRKSAELNSLKNVEVIQKVVTDSAGMMPFNTTAEGANAHSIFEQDNKASELIESSTLDAELSRYAGLAIILVDVEGAETLVLRGGKEFFLRLKPLLIFEYNFISRRHFTLDDVGKILPAGYRIFHLRRDGNVDEQFDHTWNCVAVHEGSPFYDVVRNIKR